MQENLSSSLMVLALAIALLGGPPVVLVVLGQEKIPETTSDRSAIYPQFFKLYSKDGGESLTGFCSPLVPSQSDDPTQVTKVTCKFTHVRFEAPKPDQPPFPRSLKEAIKIVPGLEKEWRDNPQKNEKEFSEGLHGFKQDFCSASSADRTFIEARIRAPETGPKRRSYYEAVIAACSNKNPFELLRRLSDQRACSLWVDQFALEFKRVQKGQWLYRQEAPGLFSKILKGYEFTWDGDYWALSETRVPTEGSEEKLTQTTWSRQNFSEYELPCDFISHSGVQAP